MVIKTGAFQFTDEAIPRAIRGGTGASAVRAVGPLLLDDCNLRPNRLGGCEFATDISRPMLDVANWKPSSGQTRFQIQGGGH
jgi:hypothetical protein